MIKQLAWDTSTENFWLDVNLYKDQMGNFPFQLLDLSVLKMSVFQFLSADKWV